MNRKKYKVSRADYELFQKQYLMDTIRDPDKYQSFGQAFLTRFSKVLDEYVYIGGDLGIAEAEKLWTEPNMERAKKIIELWID